MMLASQPPSLQSASTAAVLARREQAPRVRIGMPLVGALAFTSLLLLGTDDACAAAIGSLATSISVLAVFGALLLLDAWPLPSTGVSMVTASVALLGLGAAAPLWRLFAGSALFRSATLARVPLDGQAPTVSLFDQTPAPVLPAGADIAALRADWCRLFLRVQTAWDEGDMETLRRHTAPEMMAELCFEGRIDDPLGAGRTEVVMVSACLLAFDELPGAQLASIEFSGLIREAPDQGAAPFRELWLLSKPTPDGLAWRLARHQVLL